MSAKKTCDNCKGRGFIELLNSRVICSCVGTVPAGFNAAGLGVDLSKLPRPIAMTPAVRLSGGPVDGMTLHPSAFDGRGRVEVRLLLNGVDTLMLYEIAQRDLAVCVKYSSHQQP